MSPGLGVMREGKNSSPSILSTPSIILCVSIMSPPSEAFFLDWVQGWIYCILIYPAPTLLFSWHCKITWAKILTLDWVKITWSASQLGGIWSWASQLLSHWPVLVPGCCGPAPPQLPSIPWWCTVTTTATCTENSEFSLGKPAQWYGPQVWPARGSMPDAGFLSADYIIYFQNCRAIRKHF